MSTVDEPLGEPSERRPLLPLLVLFFLSGATGLLYEVLWMRRLTLVFGATQLAIATVLAAFMLGLAGGAALGGRVADRRRDLLVLYGVAEVVVGLWAMAFPHIIDATRVIYPLFFDAEDVRFWSSQVLHMVLMVVVLLPPTAAMGATLPLLARFINDRLSGVGTRTGLLYGFNTAGAVVGTWAAGFWLLPAFGVRATELGAAGANLTVAAVALAWGWVDLRRGAPIEVEDDAAERGEERALLDVEEDTDLLPERAESARRAVLVAMALSGACSMIFEVSWSRFLTLILGSSVYAFSLMLVAFLAGGAAGSLFGSARMARLGVRPLRWLLGGFVAAGVSAFATHHLFRMLPFWYVDLYAVIHGDDALIWVAKWLLAFVVMAPTTFSIGLLFPFATAVVARSAGSVGADISRLYLLNTLGAVSGSLLAGFVGIPLLGIQNTLLLAVVVELCLAAWIAVATQQGRSRLRVGVTLALAAVFAVMFRAPWDPLLMSSGMYKYVTSLSDYSHEAVRNYALSDYDLLYYKEGSTTVVTVGYSTGSGNIWLANNGKIDASTQSDLPTQVLLGHLPLLFRPDARDVLVVGLASGITAGSVTTNPDLDRVDILEIEPAIFEASHFFDDFNNRPLDDPRVRPIANDARNHLELYQGKYDLIVNEPSNPWITGVSNLFTREYLELGRARLREGGLFVQWTQAYGMAPDDLKVLLRTFGTVFPHVVLLSTVEDADLILVGSEQPLELDEGVVRRHLDDQRVRADVARVGVQSPYDMLTYVLMDREAMMQMVGDGVLNTDDNVHIEFSAPHYINYNTQDANARMLLHASTGPWPLMRDRVTEPAASWQLLVGLGGAFERRELWLAAGRSYVEALELPESAAMPVERADVEARLQHIQTNLRARLAAEQQQ